MSQVIVTVPAKAVYPSAQTSYDYFTAVLGRLSLSDALFYVARLGAIVSKRGRYSVEDAQQRAVRMLGLSQETVQRLNAYVASNGGLEHVRVILRGGLLELTRWLCLCCVDQPADGTTFEDLSNRESFFEGLLLAEEIWGQRVYSDIKRAVAQEPGFSSHALAITRRSMFENDLAPELDTILGRAWDLCMRYREDGDSPFSALFISATGLTLEEHFAITASMWVDYQEFVESMPNRQPGRIGAFHFSALGTTTRISEAVNTYVNRYAVDVAEIRRAVWPRLPSSDPFVNPPDFSNRPLRLRPLLRTQDGRGIILDPVFFAGHTVDGVLFAVPAELRNASISAFGRAFEEYAQDLLHRTYPSASGLVKRLHAPVKIVVGNQVKGEFDAVAACADCAFAFEMKATWLPDDQLLLGAEDRFQETLEAKYCGEHKGTGQLAKALRALAEITRDQWPSVLQNTKTVYPILTVYDRVISPTIHAHMRAKFSEQAFRTSPDRSAFSVMKGVSQFLVSPLLVISVDELEMLEVLSQGASLEQVLAEYAHAVIKSPVSLTSYLAGSRWGSQIKCNRYTTDRALEVLSLCKSLLFGEG